MFFALFLFLNVLGFVSAHDPPPNPNKHGILTTCDYSIYTPSVTNLEFLALDFLAHIDTTCYTVTGDEDPDSCVNLGNHGEAYAQLCGLTTLRNGTRVDCGDLGVLVWNVLDVCVSGEHEDRKAVGGRSGKNGWYLEIFRRDSYGGSSANASEASESLEPIQRRVPAKLRA